MLLILTLSTATTADLLTIVPPTRSLNSKSVSTQAETAEIALNIARQVQAKVFWAKAAFWKTWSGTAKAKPSNVHS